MNHKHWSKDILFKDVSLDWRNILDNALLDEILQYLHQEPIDKITPSPQYIFEFARITPLKSIKVVIIGQDPYPKKGDAHGLAFSCKQGIPKSLNNIFLCLKKHNLLWRQPNHGDLTKWAECGILLLNCALTTRINQPNAHRLLWQDYTKNLIITLSNLKSCAQHTIETNTNPIQDITTEMANVMIENKDNIVSQTKLNHKFDQSKKSIKFYKIFLLWGNNARSYKSIINKKCIILEWTHPSPLAQSKQLFTDCDHFTRVNKLLKRIGPIPWHVIIQNKVERSFNLTPTKTVIFTDGSCSPNKLCKEAIAGYAAVFVLGQFKDIIIYGNIDNQQYFASNQRAEGMAIYKTFQYLYKNINKWTECIIVSDSDFWIKMIEYYMPMWNAQNLDFKLKKNSDITIPMWKLYYKLIKGHNKNIKFRHVRSHNKDNWASYPYNSYEYFCYHNNDYVDQMAAYARINLKPGQLVIEKVEYTM